MKLKIGEISFLNALPLSLTIEDEAQELFLKSHPSDIISLPPSQLNDLMLKNALDISPVSSVFYLKNKAQFNLMPNCCIASNGPVESVLWFCEKSLSNNLEVIWVPDTSETSILLLKWMLQTRGVCAKGFKVYKKGEAKSLLTSGKTALLSIGDEALELQVAFHENNPFIERHLIVDIADEWRSEMSLPCVFATWILQKHIIDSTVITDLAKYYQDRISKFNDSLMFQNEVIQLAKVRFPELAKSMGEDAITHYLLNAISYSFGDAEQHALLQLGQIYHEINNKEPLGVS